MNVPLFIAGCLAIVAAGVHGVGGELWVVRRLSPDVLPSSRFGGARMTRAMIHVAWHIVSVSFLTAGAALIVSALALDGDTAQAVAIVTAAAFTGFALVGIGLGSAYSPQSLRAHPGPAAFVVIAALAWVGAF